MAIKDGRVVAKAFGKRPDNVCRDIRDLIAKAPAGAVLNFELRQEYQKHSNGQGGTTVSFYEMDRDAFALLAMGFTGAPAIQWKLKFIAAFNAMEQRLRADLNVRLGSGGVRSCARVLRFR